jgi:hypothetical protein
MEFYGVKGTTQKLMRSYLRGRYQGVILYKNESKCCSAWKKIQCGVPQGSVLYCYTLMTYQKQYMIYINQYSLQMIPVSILDKDPENFKIKIDKLLEIINKWFQKNLLVINCEKTCFLQFQTKNSTSLDIQDNYLNSQIPSTSDISFLGLKIDKFLTWENHIEVLIDKLNRSCFAIRLVKSILLLEALKIVYFSYVHSTYINIWNNIFG